MLYRAKGTMLGLQKELFLESMKLMQEPGWEYLQEKDLLAFKAPVSVAFMNFVYGSITVKNYSKVKDFYQNKPFYWLLSQDQKEEFLVEAGFTGPEFTFEMGLNLDQYVEYTPPSNIEVRQVHLSEDYVQWIEVAALWLNIDPLFVDQFFTPWIKTGKYIPYLGFWDGKPAATSLVYCGELGAAIYCLGTLLTFRNRGLATAVTHACLKASKDRNVSQVVLYGSEMGKSLYEKIGFKLMQTIRDYSSLVS